MKTKALFFPFLLLLLGCSKDVGSILHRVKYTTEKISLKSSQVQQDLRHKQFGAYITALTPSKFTSKINIMCYQEGYDLMNTRIISYVDGHDNDPRYEIATYADFSNNQEVAITPILYSTDMIDGVFKQKNVTFHYFNFVPYYFFQEVKLPAEYSNVRLDIEQWTSDISRTGDTIKTKNTLFLKPLYEGNRIPNTFVFGRTDSTYIFNAEGARLSPSPDYPFGGNSNATIIRSHKYTPLTVTMPEEGKTIEMFSTISFDTQNLIQVYAGNDNIPYTSDDVFVYAPNFWERLNVKLTIR